MSVRKEREEGTCTTGSENVVKLHMLYLIPTKSLQNSIILVMSTIGRKLIMFQWIFPALPSSIVDNFM